MHRKHYFSNASDRGITSIHEMQQCALEERKQYDEAEKTLGTFDVITR